MVDYTLLEHSVLFSLGVRHIPEQAFGPGAAPYARLFYLPLLYLQSIGDQSHLAYGVLSTGQAFPSQQDARCRQAQTPYRFL